MAVIADINGWTLPGVDWSNPRGSPAEVEMLRLALIERYHFRGMLSMSSNYLRWSAMESAGLRPARKTLLVDLESQSSSLCGQFLWPDWAGGPLRPRSFQGLSETASFANVSFLSGAGNPSSSREMMVGALGNFGGTYVLGLKNCLAQLRLRYGTLRAVELWRKRVQRPSSESLADAKTAFAAANWSKRFDWQNSSSLHAGHWSYVQGGWRTIERYAICLCEPINVAVDPRIYGSNVDRGAWFWFGLTPGLVYSFDDFPWNVPLTYKNNDYPCIQNSFSLAASNIPPLNPPYNPDLCVWFNKIDAATVDADNEGWVTYAKVETGANSKTSFLINDFSGAYAFP